MLGHTRRSPRVRRDHRGGGKEGAKGEVGRRVRGRKALGFTNHILPGEGIHWISPVFLARIETGIPKNAEPEKHSEMRWFDLENLPERTTLPTKDAIELMGEHIQ